MEITTIVARNVRKIRKLKGISQETLAGDAHISTRTLGNIERDKSNPTIRILYAICLALEISLDELTSLQETDAE